ncbi:MAG: hypothetical protein CL534_18500 [Ahrensia sp.]|nr:hypothetical protein [Ahrensia sp.]
MRSVLLLSLFASLVAGAFPVPAAAAPAVAETRPDLSSLTGRQAMRIIRRLVSEGRYDGARTFVADWSRGDPEAGFRARFVEGLIAGHRGDLDGAIRIYRGLLADRPGVDMVRIELTRALAAAGDYGAARFQAEKLIAAGVDDKLGGGLERLVTVFDARRPVRLRGRASLLPSTNINGGTDRETVPLGDLELDIDEDARRKSGVGMMLGGDLLIRLPLGGETDFVSTLSGTGRFYPSIDRTVVDVDASAGFTRDFGRATVLAAATAGGTFSDWAETSRYAGIRTEVKKPLPGRWRMFASQSLRYEKFENLAAKGGWWFQANVSFDRTLAASRFIRFLGGYSGGRKQAERFSFDEVSAGLGVYNEFPAGITLYTQATVARRQYRGLYPGLTEAQKDTRLSALAVVTKRDFSFAGFAPQLFYRFERNVSNAAFEDTARHEIDLRLTRDF